LGKPLGNWREGESRKKSLPKEEPDMNPNRSKGGENLIIGLGRSKNVNIARKGESSREGLIGPRDGLQGGVVMEIFPSENVKASIEQKGETEAEDAAKKGSKLLSGKSLKREKQPEPIQRPRLRETTRLFQPRKFGEGFGQRIPRAGEKSLKRGAKFKKSKFNKERLNTIPSIT